MTQKLIRQALETALKTYADANGLPVAWENVAFTPPATTYLRAVLLPVPTQSADLGRLHRQFEGVWQVSIVLQVGAGAGQGETLAAAICALYPPATPLVQGSLKVYPLQPMSAAAGITDGDRFTIPLSMPYRADTY